MIISLAQEPSVSLGPLRLSPATREISHTDGRREVVEPRVMQVLLALAKADGAIVTRDQLVQSCWAGRVVGEDAINRVISRLRKTADGIGSGVFRVETVTRVGYRLVSNVRLEASVAGPRRQTSGLQAPPRPGRRAVWALAAAVLLVAAGAGLWWSVHNPSPAALVHVQSRTPQLTILPFIPLTPDLSPALVEQTREEIVAAFGLTSFVDIVTAPSRGAPKPLAWTLSGTVARVGTDLHFVMHLTHDTTGKIVWSAAIDRPYGASGQGLKSLAATLEEILATSLTAAASYHGKAELPDATLALFIQWSQDTVLPVGHYRHGEEELRRAVALTPDFARGWSWLAGALGATATASDDPTDAAAARTAAPAVIATALRFQPDDAVALMARAKTIAPQDFKARDAAFLAATSVPTSEAGVEHSAYSVFLMNVGRLAEAVRQADIGYELDPLDPSFMNRYARALSLTGQTALA
jgi:DNA-binding winged helix-turn-helix (wHTH) protein